MTVAGRRHCEADRSGGRLRLEAPSQTGLPLFISLSTADEQTLATDFSVEQAF
jgi:hypothetical protein